MGSRLNGAAGVLTREAILRDVAPGELFSPLSPADVLLLWGTAGHVPLMMRTRKPFRADEGRLAVTVVQVIETAIVTGR